MLTLNAQECAALKQMLLEVPAKWAIPILNFLESVRATGEQKAGAEQPALPPQANGKDHPPAA